METLSVVLFNFISSNYDAQGTYPRAFFIFFLKRGQGFPPFMSVYAAWRDTPADFARPVIVNFRVDRINLTAGIGGSVFVSKAALITCLFKVDIVNLFSLSLEREYTVCRNRRVYLIRRRLINLGVHQLVARPMNFQVRPRDHRICRGKAI